MAKFLECSVLGAGEGTKISINFDNAETLEATEQHGRMGTKVTFRSGRYIVVE